MLMSIAAIYWTRVVRSNTLGCPSLNLGLLIWEKELRRPARRRYCSERVSASRCGYRDLTRDRYREIQHVGFGAIVPAPGVLRARPSSLLRESIGRSARHQKIDRLQQHRFAPLIERHVAYLKHPLGGFRRRSNVQNLGFDVQFSRPYWPRPLHFLQTQANDPARGAKFAVHKIHGQKKLTSAH